MPPLLSAEFCRLQSTVYRFSSLSIVKHGYVEHMNMYLEYTYVTQKVDQIIAGQYPVSYHPEYSTFL